MKCTECGNAMARTVGDYLYVESGLDNVMLQNVSQYTCESCGAKRVTIGAIGPLHRAIAKSLAEKPARLLPSEVRFLRDHLDLSNKEFAEVMGVSQEQTSRWTNSEPIGVPAERFLRVLAMMGPESVAKRKTGKANLSAISFKKIVGDAAIASSEELIEMIEHLPPKEAPAENVQIGLRRSSNEGWKSNARPVN